MKQNKGFPLYFDWVDRLKDLSADRAFMIICALADYFRCGTNPVLSFEGAEKVVVGIMFDQIKRAEANSELKREYANKRWNATPSNAEQCQAMPSNAEQCYNNNNNNNNNNIIITPSLSPSAEGEKKEPKEINAFEERFERFWKAYPRKQGKAAAKKAFLKIKPSDALTAVMVNAVEAQKKSRDWTKDNGEFIPHPTTWLNQGRWEDEVTEVKAEDTPIIPKCCSMPLDEMVNKALERSYGKQKEKDYGSIEGNPELDKLWKEALARSYGEEGK